MQLQTRHILAALVISTSAAAQTEERDPITPTADPSADVARTIEEPPSFALMPKVGGVFPQIMNRLQSSFVVALEANYLLPVLQRQLGFSVEGSYSQPSHTRTVEDPRVPDGSVTYRVRERTVGVYGGPKYFFRPLHSFFVPYAGAGVRAQFISSDASGAGGAENFGDHEETGTHVAFAGQVGAGLKLGPGHLALEVQLLSSPINHLVTGDVNIGDLGLRAGYLFHF